MDVNKMLRDTQKKAETFLKDHHDQIESGVTKAESFAKSKAKNPKRDAQIDKVAGTLRGLIPSDEPNGDQANGGQGKGGQAKGGHPKGGRPSAGGAEHPKAHHKPNMQTDAEPGSSD